MGFFKKIIRKVTKPISKVLDKVIPNELKPLLPYAAAFAPYMLPAGFAGGSGLSALFRRGLLTGSLNLGSQLAQEGSEGDFNPLSVGLGALQGAMTADGAGSILRSKMNPGVAATGTPVAGGQFSNALQGGFDTSGLTGLDKAKNFMLKGGAKLADLAGGAQKTLSDPFAADVTLKELATAGAAPFSEATGQLAYADANRLNKQFNRDEAVRIATDAAKQAGADQSMIDAVTSSMGAYNYTQEEIDNILSQFFSNGGRVGYNIGGRIGFKMGGGDFSAPDFISMDEVTENVDGDVIEDSFEGATAEGYKLNDFAIDEQLFNMSGKKMYYLKDGSDDGQTYDEFEVREMLYGDQYASGGIINAYNMGGNVLPQGMEMDYRQGGFIPMGSKERADDVPARVSKNEFVMTADAVRAAGGGSVNEGAKRMYGLMNNLEAKA